LIFHSFFYLCLFFNFACGCFTNNRAIELFNKLFVDNFNTSFISSNLSFDCTLAHNHANLQVNFREASNMLRKSKMIIIPQPKSPSKILFDKTKYLCYYTSANETGPPARLARSLALSKGFFLRR